MRSKQRGPTSKAESLIRTTRLHIRSLLHMCSIDFLLRICLFASGSFCYSTEGGREGGRERLNNIKRHKHKTNTQKQHISHTTIRHI